MANRFVKKRSLKIAGHQTSISLEDDFYDGLQQMAKETNQATADVVFAIEQQRAGNENLSSAIRCAVLNYFRNPPKAAA